MIQLSEEPYDGDVAVALVAALLVEINERYAGEIAGMTDEAPYGRYKDSPASVCFAKDLAR